MAAARAAGDTAVESQWLMDQAASLYQNAKVPPTRQSLHNQIAQPRRSVGFGIRQVLVSKRHHA